MSEYKSKKNNSAKSYKKPFSSTQDKKTSKFAKVRKTKDSNNDWDDIESGEKKQFKKAKSEDKPYKSGKKSSELVPRIKKRFSDYEKGSESVKSEKKTSKPYSKSKQSYTDSKEEKPYKSGKKSSESISSIKKRSSDFGKGSGSVKPERKTNRTYSKSKQSYSDSEEEKPKYKSSKTSNYKENKDFGKDKDKYSKTEQKPYSKTEQKPFRKSFKKSSGSKKSSDSNEFEGSFRLNRYIAASGMCSRREADELISLGEVKVNGVVVTEMGTKVSATDRVEVGGQSISPERKVYVLLNKPRDFVSTVSDPHADKTVMDLVKLPGCERIYPVGRLDKYTTGVMLLTNDGDLTKKLTHPSYNKKKIYHVVLDKPVTKANLQQIIDGFELEDGFISADAISFVEEGDKTQVGIELHSGRNRIVRRIFEHLGFDVIRLDRVYFAGLTKKNVARGKWRFLTDKEVSMLKRGAYE